MLDDEDRDRLRQYLILSEGIRLHPYTDTVGKLSIGVGRNLTDVGISLGEAYTLLEHDIDSAIGQVLARYPWIHDQDPVRQAVLVELAFNMGLKTLQQFVNTLAAFREKDYEKAAAGLQRSKWHRQVQPSRSARLIAMTLTGTWS